MKRPGEFSARAARLTLVAHQNGELARGRNIRRVRDR